MDIINKVDSELLGFGLKSSALHLHVGGLIRYGDCNWYILDNRPFFVTLLEWSTFYFNNQPIMVRSTCKSFLPTWIHIYPNVDTVGYDF